MLYLDEEETGVGIDSFKIRLETIQESIFTEFWSGQASSTSQSYSASLDEKVRSTVLYSEVDSLAFLSLIENLKDFDIGFPEDAIFVDLGAGPGKTLIMIGLLNVFKRAIGIEIVEPLYRQALDTIKAFTKNYRTPVDLTDMEVLCGDGTFYDWSFASLVYMQATCFNEEMMDRITFLAGKLKPGSVLIIINNRFFFSLHNVFKRVWTCQVIACFRLLKEANFDLVGILSVKYSFGNATAFVYRKSGIGDYQDAVRIKENLDSILQLRYSF